MKFILRLARQARARPQNSPQKAIPSTLLPCTRKRHSKLLRKPRQELGQMRLAKSHAEGSKKRRKKSECVSLFKRQIHDFPFRSSSLHPIVMFTSMIPRNKKEPTGPASFVWSMTQLCASFALLTNVAIQKIAARMISLIYARIRNQKWSLQWLACMNFSVASHCEGFHRCATAAVVYLIDAQMHFVPTLQSLILKRPKPHLGRPLYALSLFRVINARFSKWKSV